MFGSLPRGTGKSRVICKTRVAGVPIGACLFSMTTLTSEISDDMYLYIMV